MTTTGARWARHVITVLLIVAAGLFVVGVSSETVAVFGAGFAVLDVAEVAHQLDEANTGLALLAGAIAALHAVAAALAFHQATTGVAREPVTS